MNDRKAKDLPGDLVDDMETFVPLYNRWLHICLADNDLTPARVRLLTALELGGPQTMGTLAKALDVTSRNVTNLVDALENDRLVKRVPDKVDRRATCVHLTKVGLNVAEDVCKNHKSDVASVFAELSATEQKLFRKVQEKLIEKLQRKLGGK